jgi:hypothetical protein
MLWKKEKNRHPGCIAASLMMQCGSGIGISKLKGKNIPCLQRNTLGCAAHAMTVNDYGQTNEFG